MSLQNTLFTPFTRDLLIAYDLRYIDEGEFAILYDLNKSSNPKIPYRQYEKFDLETVALRQGIQGTQ